MYLNAFFASNFQNKIQFTLIIKYWTLDASDIKKKKKRMAENELHE